MRRFFLVGCPRSGTTLLQSLLGTHEDLATFTESHFFPEYFRARRFFRMAVGVKLPARIAEFLEENRLAGKVERPRVRTGVMFRPFAVAEARKCLGLLDAMAQALGKTGWLEKTPRNLHRITLIREADPEIEFVHILREPLGAVASLEKASAAWGVPLDPRAAAARWSADIRISLACADRPGHLFVLYEDLVRRPDAVIARLVGALGLDPSRTRLEAYREVAARVTTPEESWKSQNTGAITAREAEGAVSPVFAHLFERELTPLYQTAFARWHVEA